jgi:hypothetical protein
MMRKAEHIYGDEMKVYQVNENIIPFSFGSSVFINRHLHTVTDLQEIIRHEFVHIKQKHSFDIIWSEILCLFNWFNPFAWLLKKSIRQNLEFIADNKVLENGLSKKEYQYLLLKVTGNNQYSIATQFNFSSLKKRIAMMNKLKSAKANLLRFLFMLPMLAVILLSFRKQIESSFNRNINSYASVVNNDTLPDAKIFNDKGFYIEIRKNKIKDNPLVIIKDKEEKEVRKMTIDEWNSRMEYYENLYGQLPVLPQPPDAPWPINEQRIKTANPSVESVAVNNSLIIVVLRNGRIEKYNLEDIFQKIDFDKKYGSLPEPPPPPKLPMGVKDISINGKNLATVTMENGSVEKFDLNRATEKEKYEKKYGDIVPPPTLPTPPPAVSSASSASVVAAGVEIAPVSASVSDPVTVAGVEIAPIRASVSALATVVGVRNASSSVAAVSALDIAMVSGNVSIADEAGILMTGDEAIVITITKNTNRQELDEFVKQMKAKGVEMSYDEIEYDSKGTLVNISGSLKSKTGHSNFVGQGFSKLVLALMKKGEKTWFKVSVTDGKVVI